jgi:undecaprenyl-diphosphatase
MKEKRNLLAGAGLIGAFALWTVLIRWVDVQAVGQNGTKIGFADFNVWFHQLTGVHMDLYTVTDWLGLVPVAVCIGFGVLGLTQWIKRRSLLQVDADILLLGLYFVIVIAGYLLFEIIPINYRPILIEGRLEASYPSSTTLLVLSVMPSLVFQVQKRAKQRGFRVIVIALTITFTVFMVAGRLFAGVHWLTDIAGGVLLSSGLFYLYKEGVSTWNSMKNYKN